MALEASVRDQWKAINTASVSADLPALQMRVLLVRLSEVSARP